MLTPSSFIPRSLDLLIRQVDDCVADDKEVLLEGVDAVIEAEVEVDDIVDLSVGVVSQKYEESGPRGLLPIFLLERKWREIRQAGRRWRRVVHTL